MNDYDWEGFKEFRKCFHSLSKFAGCDTKQSRGEDQTCGSKQITGDDQTCGNKQSTGEDQTFCNFFTTYT